jgi:hypothetical protein
MEHFYGDKHAAVCRSGSKLEVWKRRNKTGLANCLVSRLERQLNSWRLLVLVRTYVRVGEPKFDELRRSEYIWTLS